MIHKSLPNTKNLHISPVPSSVLPIWKTLVPIVATVLFTIALIVLIPMDVIERLGNYGYLGIFILTFLSNATIILPSPALAAAFLGGTTLNPWLVGLCAGVAAGLGETTGYIAGYSGSSGMIHSRFYPRIEHWVKQWGTVTMFTLAFIPLPLIDLAGIAAGTMRMPFRSYLSACIFGKTLRFMLIAWMGYLSGHIL